MPQSNDSARPPSTTLAGWGAYLRSDAMYREPETSTQTRALLDVGGTIARGLGRSYGDAALNGGHSVLGTARMNRLLAFDGATGLLRCEAGTSLAEIVEVFGPRGFFPLITPGTKHVTVGGCIANDVHGKAHHAHGSFAACVDEMTVLLASGEIVVASRETNADLFWATFGGMGLLGIVLEATIRLRTVETSYFRRKKIVVDDLAAMMAALEENDAHYPYSVATLDVTARGARLGRGVLVVGDHATKEELPRALADAKLRISPRAPRVDVPFELPSFTLNRLSIRIVNAVILAIQGRDVPYAHYESFFYPLDMLGHWNRGYGRAGFAQYQLVIPLADAPKRMQKILALVLSSGELPFLNVLKRLGDASGGHLSFPERGVTFAIDFPMRASTVSVLRRLDAMVLDAGGRVYLGKDASVERASFRAMYPRLDEWLAVKAKYDPAGVFTSDLGRRVGLCGP